MAGLGRFVPEQGVRKGQGIQAGWWCRADREPRGLELVSSVGRPGRVAIQAALLRKQRQGRAFESPIRSREAVTFPAINGDIWLSKYCFYD